MVRKLSSKAIPCMEQSPELRIGLCKSNLIRETIPYWGLHVCSEETRIFHFTVMFIKNSNVCLVFTGLFCFTNGVDINVFVQL